MTIFSKVLCQPSMADPHLRPGRPLRDRRAGAQSHVRGYRSSCDPHLASSSAAASCASLPTRGGMRAISAAVAGVGLAGHRASGGQLPATSEEPSRAGPRVLADREGHRRPAPSCGTPGCPARGPRHPRREACARAPVRSPGRGPAPGSRRPDPPRARGRVDGRPRAGGLGDPLGPGPRLIVGDLGRLGGQESHEAVPRDPASPRPTGRGQARRCWHLRACRSACARPATCRVGTRSHPRAGAPPRGRRPSRPWLPRSPLGHLSVVVFPGVRVSGSPSPSVGVHVVVAHGWPLIPRHAR